jgi:hypothetical protein
MPGYLLMFPPLNPGHSHLPRFKDWGDVDGLDEPNKILKKNIHLSF